MDWNKAQAGEAAYWGNCLGMTAWGEFVKQEMYGREMGLFADYGTPFGELDMQNKSVLDVGGGPVSMTLRCVNSGELTVVDPCNWPRSVLRRYHAYGINFIQAMGEDFETGHGSYDEVWIYNVLQHVEDPAKVIANALTRGKILRIFEWCYIPADDKHPHVLTPADLLNWLKGTRIKKVSIPVLTEYWATNATAFCGVFEI